MIYKTYRGARLDLQFYKGKSTINFVVSIFNDDDSDFDLTIYSDIVIVIQDKKHGTVILTLSMDDGEVSLASPADNDIYLDLSHVQTDLRVKEYWYECYGIREDDEQELIFFGVAEMF